MLSAEARLSSRIGTMAGRRSIAALRQDGLRRGLTSGRSRTRASAFSFPRPAHALERSVKKLMVCSDKTEANQMHKGHAMCRKPKKKDTPSDDCLNIGPDPDNRCRPAKPVTKRTKAQAKQLSDQNEAAARENHADIVKKYNDAKEKIRDEQAKANQKKYKDPSATGFPAFDVKDLCEDGPNDVNIGVLCGFDDGDFAAANNLAGYEKTPPKCTWHHHQDLGRFVLLKQTNHAEWFHWGGRAIWKRAFEVKYPSHCKKI
jgi:hypothetical protein